MAIPNEGETIQIHSYKHNGKIHRVWQETMVLKGTRKYCHWWQMNARL